MFEIRPCRSRAALEAVPKKNLRVNLESVKKRFKVIAETPIAVVIDSGCEVIVHRYGKLTFKNLSDTLENRETARGIAESVYQCIEYSK